MLMAPTFFLKTQIGFWFIVIKHYLLWIFYKLLFNCNYVTFK